MSETENTTTDTSTKEKASRFAFLENISFIPFLIIGNILFLAAVWFYFNRGTPEEVYISPTQVVAVIEATSTPVIEEVVVAQATATLIPTETAVPPTATNIPPTNTPLPTVTNEPVVVPPTETTVPPTATAIIEPTALPAATNSIILIELTVPRLNLREQATIESTALLTITQDMFPLEPIGRNAEATWVKVQLESQQFGWLSAEYLTISGNIYSLPVSN